MEKIGIVIQARMGSTRLPNKVLKDFCGKPMLKFMIDILDSFNLPYKKIVATSISPVDDIIADFCSEYSILCFQGSEKNVFERYRMASIYFSFDHVIRLTGDNPLTNYKILTACIQEHLRNKPDLTSTRKIKQDGSIERYTPKGNSVDIINCKTLLSIDSNVLSNFEKERVIPVFFNDRYKVSSIKEDRYINMDLSIDDYDDLTRVSNYAKDLLDKGKLLQELGYNEKTFR
jgi:spore coat polysaccharide biosynthesis protein SpsF